MNHAGSAVLPKQNAVASATTRVGNRFISKLLGETRCANGGCREAARSRFFTTIRLRAPNARAGGDHEFGIIGPILVALSNP